MLKKISLIIFILVILIVTYNLIRQIFNSTKSGERLSQAAENVYLLEQKNKELKEKLSKIQDPGFIEEEARNKLGLAKPGETIVVIPDEKLRKVLEATQSSQVKLPNWQGWIKVFFR